MQSRYSTKLTVQSDPMRISWTSPTNLLDRIRILVPCNCVVCSFPVSGPVSLCDHCERELPKLEHACLRCSIPLVAAADAGICGKCLLRPPLYDRCISLFHYTQPISGMIGEFKFHASFAAGRILGCLLAERFDTYYRTNCNGRFPDLLLPIPLHPRRLRRRGFDQCLLLAREIEKKSKIAVAAKLLRKTRDTQPQSALTARERKTNLGRSFALDSPIDATIRHIALIEDVVTTGATIDAIANVLRQQETSPGKLRIDVWAIARADLSNNSFV